MEYMSVLLMRTAYYERYRLPRRPIKNRPYELQRYEGERHDRIRRSVNRNRDQTAGAARVGRSGESA